MGSRPVSRRQFLSGSLGAGLGWGLSGCSTLDRIVMGDFKDEAERVMILGGGLAGLMAAYQLKKSNVHFHVFEANQRIGGRVYSVPEFFRGQDVAELGAEFFSAEQKMVLDLALELKLETIEITDINSRARLRRLNTTLPVASIGRELAALQRSQSRAESVESLRQKSLSDWVRTRTRDKSLLEFVNDWALEKYGASGDDVASEVFATAFDRMRSPLGLWTESRHRFRGGTGALAQALFDRTAGFQPERSFSLRHRLRAIRKRTRGMDLIFETPEGERSVFARSVICALPLAVLRDVEGIQEFAGPWTDEAAFRVGQHSKFIYSYNERFWGGEWNQSKLLEFGDGQVAWESSYRLNPLFQFRQGVLSVLWGGEAAKAAGPQHRQSIQRELESLFRKKPGVEMIDQVMVNWSLQPFAKGSVSYPRPGASVDAWEGASDEWVWAGEHTVWRDRGTLQGALDSGLKAANYVIQNRPQRFFPV